MPVIGEQPIGVPFEMPVILDIVCSTVSGTICSARFECVLHLPHHCGIYITLINLGYSIIDEHAQGDLTLNKT